MSAEPALAAAESDASSAQDVAERFLRARREARALPTYPGPIPADMAQSYRVQDAALSLTDDRVVGWKLGRISPELEGPLGAGRLAGPIFASRLWRADPATPTDVPVFVGGFAAVEAEYVLRVAHDQPPGRLDWSLDAAADMADALFVGVEMAGSPLASINIDGPTAVASDFGNNAGLILGPAIDDWRSRPLENLICETWIDGRRVGAGGAEAIPGGPVDSLRFLLELQARRGRPLRKGDLISTGAATGIHEIAAGQSATVRFGGDGEIRLRAVAAQAGPDAGDRS